MTRLATSWLVYRLTDSAFLLGLVSFIGLVPAFFLPAFAGVWVDRWDRHKVLIATQVLAINPQDREAAALLRQVQGLRQRLPGR